ncbi:hypothetical protein [Methylobacter sp.]|nr:hypothetical protein [Methylobacter sp.]
MLFVPTRDDAAYAAGRKALPALLDWKASVAMSRLAAKIVVI